MGSTCTCRVLSTLAAEQATAYANRYLREVSPGDGSLRLMRCRICGAFWELQEVETIDEESRRVRLHRVRTASAVEDWRVYESADRD
jgi:hypothetical protein